MADALSELGLEGFEGMKEMGSPALLYGFSPARE